MIFWGGGSGKIEQKYFTSYVHVKKNFDQKMSKKKKLTKGLPRKKKQFNHHDFKKNSTMNILGKKRKISARAPPHDH